MKVYAVTCDPARMERLRNKASPLNLDIQDVNSPLFTDQEVVRRGKTCFEKGTAYPTGLAATIGHIRAMQRLVDSGDQFAIIVEDDVRFHRDFNNSLPILEKYMRKHDVDILSIGFVNLPSTTMNNITFYHGIPIVERVSVSNPWGAQCYMIRKSYANFFTQIFSVDDLSIPYSNKFVTDHVIFDSTELYCKRSSLMFPIVIECPDEQSIAGNNNKPNLLIHFKKEHFYM